MLLPLNTARGPCSRPVCCSCRFLPARQHRHGAQHSSRRQQPSRRRRASSIRTVALVSVEFNPALLLGLGIMGSGLLLYQLRQTKTAISRDTDIFISCICLCSGGILVFQVNYPGGIAVQLACPARVLFWYWMTCASSINSVCCGFETNMLSAVATFGRPA